MCAWCTYVYILRWAARWDLQGFQGYVLHLSTIHFEILRAISGLRRCVFLFLLNWGPWTASFQQYPRSPPDLPRTKGGSRSSSTADSEFPGDFLRPIHELRTWTSEGSTRSDSEFWEVEFLGPWGFPWNLDSAIPSLRMDRNYSYRRRWPRSKRGCLKGGSNQYLYGLRAPQSRRDKLFGAPNCPTNIIPTNIIPTNIALLKLSGKSPMDMRIPPL